MTTDAAAERCRADLGCARRRLDGVRRAVHPPRRVGPPVGASAGHGRGRRGPGLRGVRQGAHHRPARRRPGPGVPRLPAHRGPQPLHRHRARHHPAAAGRRLRAVRRRRPFPRHGRGGLREPGGGTRVRDAARAVAAGAVAHRGRGAEARRGRQAARHVRQLRLRPRLPRPRGSAPGVPEHARPGRRGRRLRVDPGQPGRLHPQRREQARRGQGPGAHRRVPALHGHLPRAVGGQHQPLRHHRPDGAGQCRRRLHRRQRGAPPMVAWSGCSAGPATSSATTPRASPWPGPRP